MRRHQQKQLLELIKTIHEANGLIKKFIDDKDYESAIKLMIDCHESAVSMGTTIEKIEGEGTQTVTHLEKYCDILFEVSASLVKNPDSNRVYELIKSQLKIIENSIINEIKADRIEIVFFPYKASMWDSMESVWMAAKDDPKCDVYVVPIPYYDVNPDGSLGKMHYEGDQFPDDVPVTDWASYSLKDRHPDIIYIHNPYDEYNLVTRVHPEFFSSQLRNYTDMLVYIPYFVVSGSLPENFCVLPGTLYSHRVIVESERVKNIYINELQKFARKTNQFEAFKDVNNKFLVLGSPKYDKVKNTKREDCVLPESWRKLIYRPDGNRKKVILYNTSINGILSGNEKYISKLKNVFGYFKNRNDVVLLWRPHPLSISAYTSMRPHLLNDYLRIVEEYKREGWGIYDDTSDMNRAIALSDAYYGDWSSLVALYRSILKPVMIQKCEIHGGTDTVPEREAIGFHDFYSDGDFIWVAANNCNGLFKINISNMEAEYMGSFPGEKLNGLHLYRSVAKVGSKLYFAPFMAERIGIYDLSTNTFKPGPEVRNNDIPFKFEKSVVYNDCIYFLPQRYKAVVRYNTITNELTYIDDYMNELKEKSTEKYPMYFGGGVAVIDNKAYIPFRGKNAILEISLIDHKCRTLTIGYKEDGYVFIYFCFGYFWLVGNNGAITKWNPETSEIQIFSSFPKNFRSEGIPFISLIDYGRNILALQHLANMAVLLDAETGEMNEFKGLAQDNIFKKPGSWDGNYYFIKSLDDNHLVAVSKYDNAIVFIDKNSGKVTRKKSYIPIEKALLLSPQFQSRFSETEADDSIFLAEATPHSLESFVNIILASEQLIDNDINSEDHESYGFKIHNAIKNQILGQGRYR
ncbi:MAG: hypothetical protein GX184_10550 [Clostridiaceae bacterium]|nr:hypothetical protein [Clostridiaceae bacterium]